MSTVFLLQKRKFLYHRVWIPQALRGYFNGRAEVWRSLKTTDREEASYRAHRLTSEAKRVFYTLRRYGQSMTPEEIDRLIARWLDTQLEEAEASRSRMRDISDDHREGVCSVLHDQMEDAAGDLLSNNFRRIEKEADELLKAAGVAPLDHESMEYGRLCRRLLRAQMDYLHIEMERWDGVYKDAPVAATTTRQAEVRAEPAVAAAAPTTSPPARLFTEVVTMYHKENPPRSPRSQQQTLAEFQTFLKVIGGDKPINHISKADCRKYKEDLRDRRQNKPATISKWLAVLSGVFRWAERQDFISENPVKGFLLTKKQAREGAEHYREFSDEELMLTFGSDEFKAPRDEHPERYWICLLMLFQVCRRKEPSQLNIADISEEDGIPYIHFKHDGKEQTTKTESSVRRVPIHPTLLQLGIMDYIHSIQGAGHTRLFPQRVRGTNRDIGDAVGKWFSRLKKKKGLNDPLLAPYSTRHTGTTRMSNIGVPEKIRMMITGHASQGIHGQVYDRRERVPMRLLKEGLERLQYPNVLEALSSKDSSTTQSEGGVRARPLPAA